jgi:type II secretory ATPase GspE/PulE/Tfp pilus assembly ATPase PilB-like protein
MDISPIKQNLNISDDATKQKLAKKISSLEEEHKEEGVKQNAAQTDMPYINLGGFPISQEAIKILPRESAEALQTVCFIYTGDEMRLASTNPDNPQLSTMVSELADKYHARVKLYLVSQQSLEKALLIYDKIPNIEQVDGVQITESDLEKFNGKLKDLNSLNELLKEVGLTETLNLIIAAGLQFSASDIHLEAEEKNIQARLRVDGVLQNAAQMPIDSWSKISSRIKLLSGLKLNIVDKPQDGRFTINLAKDKVDVRVSTIPSTYGESIVMRLLKSASIGLEFEKLGLRGKSFNDLNNEVSKPNGMIITTGPTGSGKTTTLYAILNKLNSPDTKIITLEDPIEYKLAGIVQSQVESQDGSDTVTAQGEIKKINHYTFAKGLRAILRQDPDIIMVGEIRDLETADTAINAALTGHLMLSTLHTNSAAGAIPRFLAMGVKPFLLAPSLNSIIGQRLIRKLCPDCRIEDRVDNQRMTEVMNNLNSISPKSGAKLDDLSNLKFFKAEGCDKCNNLGYKGRIGIYEVMTMTPEIEKMILSGNVSEYELEQKAIEGGMITMLQDGILKAKDGVTSLEEVFSKAKD